MSRLKHFLHEVHRRTLWQSLAVYLGASFAVLEAVDLLIERLGLPVWFFPSAFVLLVVGLPVVMLTALTQSAGVSPGVAEPADVQSERHRRVRQLFTWRNAISGGVIAFALWGVIAAGWLALGDSGAAVEPGAYKSIAVLPLSNFMGADPEQEYFVDGMTEQLITELAQISDLTVISRTSVMQYKDTEKTIREIGEELGADVVVEGSVLKAEYRVRINAQLVETATDRHLWAESYERDLRDVLALQKEVARAIAQEIRIRVTPAEQERLASARPVDPEAYDAYLKGVYHNEIFARGGATQESLHTSIEYHQEAIRRDSGWALAHAGLAYVYHWLASSGGGAEFWSKSKAEALKALELDEGLAQAHASLALVLLWYDFDWEGAERELRRASQLDPNSHNWIYGLFLWSAGRYEEAIASFRREEERNPNSLIVKAQLGLVYACAGQYDNAVEQLQKVIELEADFALAHFWLGDTYLRKSMYEEAIAELEKATELGSAGAGSRLGYAYARAGRTAEAQEILRELEATEDPFFAELYVALGDKDKALAQYQGAYERRHGNLLLFLRCWVEYDSLQDDPRFQDLVRRINFPD